MATEVLEKNQMVYAYVAGCWVSGQVVATVGDAVTVRLVTGNQILRQRSELKEKSPRLDNPAEWPL